MNRALVHLTAIIPILVIIGCSSEDITPPVASTTPAVATTRPVIGIDLETVTPIRGTPNPISTVEVPKSVAQPTDAPTPNFYTVVTGDTLFDIARANNTTVDELIELNPEIDPNLLTIGGQLILPAASPAPLEISSENEISPAARILSVNLFDSKTGGVFILGEVENQGPVALENTQVEVILLDKMSGEGKTVHFWVEPGIIPPGSKAPFGHFLSYPISQIELNGAAIVASNQAIDLGNRYLDLAVANVEITDENGSRSLVGDISNIGDMLATEITLVASLYDNEDNLSGYYQLTFDELLAPGTKRPFEIFILTPGNQVISFDLIIQGLVETNS